MLKQGIQFAGPKISLVEMFMVGLSARKRLFQGVVHLICARSVLLELSHKSGFSKKYSYCRH